MHQQFPRRALSAATSLLPYHRSQDGQSHSPTTVRQLAASLVPAVRDR
jgi:hypothetical protein